ncbi:YdcF family protein [uncultured Shewanella sp.]|uniref:YdcF family protein n=1 Tax=uncultured Shewanella sp. TaxID=173975 RepID=UPI00261A8AB1|nr:YdcF family protein [uncultured Shewanella sp.]
MSLILLVILVLLIGLCFKCQYRKSAYGLSILTVILFFLIGNGVVPRYLLMQLQQDYQRKPNLQWASHNVIILLGAGTIKIPGTGEVEPPLFAYGRIVETAVQYQDCHQSKQECWIIISGGDPSHNGMSEAKVYQDWLVDLGVPEKVMITEPNSLNTWQNAQFTRQILVSDHDFSPFTEQNSISVLMTSALHLRRSELYFNHFGINAIPFRADYLNVSVSWLPTGYAFALTDFALHEYVGYWRYFIYNMMGWNAPQQQAVFISD